MIYIWNGRGWLAVIIFLMSLSVSMPCANIFVDMTLYKNETAIQIGIALIYAGAFIRTFFLLFPAKAPRHFIDVETGEEVFVRQKDSLYYLDVKYWAYGFIVFGLLTFTIAFFTAIL